MGGPNQSLRRSGRSNLRHKLACGRCQKRKIRCDGNVPACNNCKRANVKCTEGDSVRIGDLPRAQISRLRQRNQWLESIIKDRCPDVDLSKGPDAGAVDHDDAPGQDPDVSVPFSEIDQDDSTVVNTGPSIQTQDPDLDSESARVASGPVQRINEQPAAAGAAGLLSHEIGLVSLNGSQDPRYIGPSSGHFLARIMLSTRRADNPWRSTGRRLSAPNQSFASELVEALQGPLPLPSPRHAELLCEQYFDVVHWQYPILHKQTFMAKLSHVLATPDPEPEDAFQVDMVLAIGSIVASERRRVRLPSESYCLSALQYLDRINVENSLQGLQCLLLLQIFTFHCSNMKLNVWYLNYQCIAAVLDLGLQRNITTKSGISLVEQEMRTRIFWVVLMLDRRIATMMGRPIGLRDEACDLRMPLPFDDDSLISTDEMSASLSSETLKFSLHLFKLAKLNSEIKYVANSIVRSAPRYAYPSVIDYDDWRTDILNRLDDWARDIPQTGPNCYMHIVSQIQHQSLLLVLLRPSPAFPNPPPTALQRCHDAARQNLRLISQLYRSNLLIHTWDTFYSLVLSAITRMYCIKSVADLARRTDPENFLGDMGDTLSILSATGEHWPGAKRCRDILDDMGRGLVRWLKEPSPPAGHIPDTQERRATNNVRGISSPQAWDAVDSDLPTFSGSDQIMMPMDDISTLPLFAQDSFGNFAGSDWNPISGDATNMDVMIRSLFDDFIPDGGEGFNFG